VEEGDAVWLRAGVLGHDSDITPLVIPFRSAGARALTYEPDFSECKRFFGYFGHNFGIRGAEHLKRATAQPNFLPRHSD